ncbi:MAG: F-box-like domain-containing protein [Alphaproteobacteria bacterium]|jgi:hypothetical protein|nr:hypothetical protein [Alphaproteobacteria bacterium]
MKTHSLFKTAFSFLFFSVSCPAAFDPALELDTSAVPSAPAITFPDALEVKDPPSAPPQDLGPYFSLLPHEKMLDIISYLDAKSLFAFSQTCKTIDDLVGHSAQGNLKQVTYDQFDTFYEPARLKKGALSALKSEGCSFLAPGTPLPQGARPLDSLERLAFFNQIFSTHKENLIDADLMCLDAVCPLIPKEYSPETTLSKALVFLERNASQPFPSVRFSENLDPKSLQRSSTLVLTTSELKAHKDVLGAHLAHNPEHRVHLILGDGAFMENGALSMTSEDLPDNLCHLILSDPAGRVTKINDSFLQSHASLTTFDTRGPLAVKTVGKFFLFYCTALKSVDTRGFTALTTIDNSFLSFCTDLERFDTIGLTALKYVDSYFLSNCKNLNTFETTPLTALETVKDCFLFYCTGLERFDPRGFIALKMVEGKFLCGCFQLPETEKEKIRAQLAARGIKWQ